MNCINQEYIFLYFRQYFSTGVSMLMSELVMHRMIEIKTMADS